MRIQCLELMADRLSSVLCCVVLRASIIYSSTVLEYLRGVDLLVVFVIAFVVVCWL